MTKPSSNECKTGSAVQHSKIPQAADLPAHSGSKPENIQQLPSGRMIVVSAGPHGEQIEVKGSDGMTQVKIKLTAQGPVLSLSGARFEIESTDTVAVNCARFEVNAQDVAIQSHGDMSVNSDAQIRLKSGGETFIDGDFVHLNCLDRTGYHDENEQEDQNDQLVHDDSDGPQALPQAYGDALKPAHGHVHEHQKGDSSNSNESSPEEA